jgi:hypothetical protein
MSNQCRENEWKLLVDRQTEAKQYASILQQELSVEHSSPEV